MAADTFELFSLTSRLTLDKSQFDRGVNDARRQVQGLTRDSGAMKSAVAGALGGITALVGFSITNQIRAGAAAWFEYASSLEATKIAFTVMLGSEQAALRHLEELQKFALRTPFEFSELVAASQRMQALGFNASQIVPILNDVGNAVAAAGGGGERLDRVVLALSQIQSKGKLATQEMNQLAESGIPAWKMLEQQFGKSRAELAKLVEQGKISSDVFLEVFQTFSRNNFGGLMEKQSKTAIGALSNIKDALLALSEEALRPTFLMISKGLGETADSLETNKAQWRSWGNTISSVVNFVLTQLGHVIRGAELVAEGFRKTFGEGSFFGDMAKGETMERWLSLPNNQVMNLRTREVFNIDAQGQLTSTRPTARGDDAGEFAIPGGWGTHSVGAGMDQPSARRTTLLPGGGGRGGRGAGRDLIADQRQFLRESLESTLTALEGEADGTKRSYEKRRLTAERYFSAIQRLEGERHKLIIESIDAEIAQAQKMKDPRERQLALLDLGTQKQREMNRYADEEWQLHNEIKNVTRERIALVDTLIQRTTREREVLKQIAQERFRFAGQFTREDLGGGSFVLTRETREGITRPRIATVEKQFERDRYAEQLYRIQSFAADLTYTIESALNEGFRRGIKAGVVEFGLGILQMAQHEALKRLQKVIADLLADTLGGLGGATGGGGWLSRIFGVLLGGITGAGFPSVGISTPGAAGSSLAGAIGGRQHGGFVFPNDWSWVGEGGRELIKAGPRGASVMSRSESASTASRTNAGNPIFNIYTRDAESFGSRDTQNQLRRKYRRMMAA